MWDEVQRTVFSAEMDNPDSLWAKSQPNATADANGDVGEDDLVFDSDDEAGISPIAVDFKEVVEKLDAMLRLVFQYIHDFAQQNPGERLRILFDVLLNIFDRTILPTHKLRCTQFLWFYACSLDPSFPELFMGLLVSKLFDVSAPSVIRVSAAAYLGSFISRSKYLSMSSVRTCLKLLHGWAYAYVEANEVGPKQADVDKYAVFYSAVQAVIYVFCFRWRQLMGWGGELGRNGYGMLPAEMTGFQRVLMSRFLPMRVSYTIFKESSMS